MNSKQYFMCGVSGKQEGVSVRVGPYRRRAVGVFMWEESYVLFLVKPVRPHGLNATVQPIHITYFLTI